MNKISYRKWIPLSDLLFWPIIAIIMTSAIIFALLSNNYSDSTLGVSIGVVSIVWIIVILVILNKWLEKPDLISADGWVVWTNGISVNKSEVKDAIDFFVEKLPVLMDEYSIPRAGVSESSLFEMISYAKIELSAKRLIFANYKYNGLQAGYAIKVNWLGGFKYNAFFHELMHMVDEKIFKIPPDYRHYRQEWWRLASLLKKKFKPIW